MSDVAKIKENPNQSGVWHGLSLVLSGASSLFLLPTSSSLHVFFPIINVESRTRRVEGQPLTFSKFAFFCLVYKRP